MTRTMINLRISTLIMAAFFLTGCETSYGPAGEVGGFEHGGYTNKLIDRNTAIVTFRGDQNTPRGKIQTYLLFHCAQVTLDNGYDYFIIISSSTSLNNVDVHTRDKYLITTPPTLYDSYYLSDTYESSTLTSTATPGYYPQLYGSVAVIKMFQGRVRGIPGKSYDANDVIAHLGPATF